MSRSVHSVKLNPYHSTQLSSLSYTLGDVVFDQDNLTLRVMDGTTFGGWTLASQSWTQNYINNVFSTAVLTVGNSSNSNGTYPSGALRIAGGVSIKKDTYMDGLLTVNGNATFNSQLNATLTTSAQPNITSLGTLQGLTSSGAVVVTANTAATSLGTGALQVSGGASIAGNLYVGGNLQIAGNELVISNPTFDGTTTLAGSTSPGTVVFTITNGAATPITKFQVDSSSGNTAISGTLNVTGNSILTGILTVNGTGITLANGTQLSDATGKFYVNALRTDNTPGTNNIMFYNPSTYELTYGSAPAVNISATAPSGVVAGALWYNSNNGNMYVYYTDANGSHWVQPTVGDLDTITYTLPSASSSVLGGVIVPAVGTSGLTNTNGTVGLATASTTQLGGVKVDGTTITISNGVISGANTYVLPTASQTQLGGVKVDGSSIKINNGVISGLTADGVTITNTSGVINANYDTAYFLSFMMG